MTEDSDIPDNLSLREEYLYPDREFWESDIGAERRKKLEEAQTELVNADIVSVNDTDSDGLFCAAFVEEVFADADVATVFSGHNASEFDLTRVLREIETNAPDGAPVIISDICPNEEDLNAIERRLEVLTENHGHNIIFFDHHNWSDDMYDTISEFSEMHIESDGSVCTANIIYKCYKDRLDEERKEHYRELAEVTRDHDIWIKNNPQSSDLATLQFTVSKREYMDVIQAYGADFMTIPEYRSKVIDTRLETERQVEFSVKTAQWEEYDVNWPDRDALTVSYVYGDVYAGGAEVLYDGWEAWHLSGTDEGEQYMPILTHDEVENESEEYPGWQKVADYSYNMELLPSIDYSNSYLKEPDQETDFGEGDADLVYIIQPFNKVDLRSHGDTPVCDILADAVGDGGGHDCAAGTQLHLVGSSGAISYNRHFESEGQLTKAELALRTEKALNEEEVHEKICDRISELTN